jgi:hypothetical protein
LGSRRAETLPETTYAAGYLPRFAAVLRRPPGTSAYGQRGAVSLSTSSCLGAWRVSGVAWAWETCSTRWETPPPKSQRNPGGSRRIADPRRRAGYIVALRRKMRGAREGSASRVFRRLQNTTKQEGIVAVRKPGRDAMPLCPRSSFRLSLVPVPLPNLAEIPVDQCVQIWPASQHFGCAGRIAPQRAAARDVDSALWTAVWEWRSRNEEMIRPVWLHFVAKRCLIAAHARREAA